MYSEYIFKQKKTQKVALNFKDILLVRKYIVSIP